MKHYLLSSLFVSLFLFSGLNTAADLKQQIQQDSDYLGALYQHLHQHPEVSFQENLIQI